MKKKYVRSLVSAAVGGALLVGVASPVSASTNWVLYPFNSENELTNTANVAVPPTSLGDFFWYPAANTWTLSWTSYPTNQFDPTLDAASNPSSGSIKQFYYWIGSGFQQAFDFVEIPVPYPINGAAFTYFQEEVRIDPSSTFNGSGIGEMFVIANSVHTNADLSIAADWSDLYRFNPVIGPLIGNWVTHQGTFPSVQTNIFSFFTGLQGGGWTNVTGEAFGLTILNRDNLRLVTPPVPSPTLKISRAAGGVEFVPEPTGAANNAATFSLSIANAFTSPALNWMGVYSDSGTAGPVPVTYAFNISQFPTAAYSNYVAKLIVAPEAATPEGWRNHPEISLANAMYITITNNSDGTATANFMWKTNAADGNTNWITIGNVSAPTAVGTWSLTCSNTLLTLKAPGGGTVSGTVPDDVAYSFLGTGTFNDGVTALRLWMGVEPRLTNNWSQMTVISQFQASYVDSLTGVNVLTNDNFSTDFSANWISASDSLGVNPRPSNTVYRISWNGPGTGFTLRQSASISAAGPWAASGLPVADSNTNKVAFVPATGVISPGFYRLYNPNP